MNTALVCIATGTKYQPYIRPFLKSAAEFLVPHTQILFTDSPDQIVTYQFYKEPLGFPGETLMRYRTILNQADILSEFDYIFYADIDMKFVAPVGEEIFSSGITAVQHAGYLNRTDLPVEKRKESTAYCPDAKLYFAGGFNGGTSQAFLKMAAKIAGNVGTDNWNGVTAVWHDESHLNRYLHENPPAKILSPSYCYPETNIDYYRAIWQGDFEPKLVALTKP